MSARLILIILIMAQLAGCSKAKVGDVPVERELAIENLKLSEIRHDSLTVEQLKKIRRIHHVFSEVISSSLDETINNFRRDKNPDREIEIWLKMADAYERFALNLHVEEHDKKDEAFQLILLRSMMEEGEAVRKADLQYLSKDEVKDILSYYNAPPQQIRILKK